MEITNMTEHKKIDKKKEYHTPKMEVIGEVRDVTQGGGEGLVDGGMPATGDGLVSQPAGGH